MKIIIYLSVVLAQIAYLHGQDLNMRYGGEGAEWVYDWHGDELASLECTIVEIP